MLGSSGKTIKSKENDRVFVYFRCAASYGRLQQLSCSSYAHGYPVRSSCTAKSPRIDRKFVSCSDHGAPGILGMPSGEFLYADKFTKTLHEKAQSK